MHELAGQKASISTAAQGIIIVFRLFVSRFWTLENDMIKLILYVFIFQQAQSSKLFDVNG